MAQAPPLTVTSSDSIGAYRKDGQDQLPGVRAIAPSCAAQTVNAERIWVGVAQAHEQSGVRRAFRWKTFASVAPGSGTYRFIMGTRTSREGRTRR
jgi:hypothetical protein